jgi:hypothetical protein
MLNLKPREPSLRRLISRQCHCSRRSVYLLDEQYDFPTDNEIDAFVESVKSTQFQWEHEIHDCDDLAREFWTKSKTWFCTKRMNVASAFIWQHATDFKKAHAFNFFSISCTYVKKKYENRICSPARTRLCCLS